MNQFKLLIKGFALLGIVGLLSSCGGGGGGGGVDPDPPTNTAPIANAGLDVKTTLNSRNLLNGSSSTDADNDTLTYSWSLASVPFGSSATLSNPTISTPWFITDVAGEYLITLVVSDGIVDSAEDSVILTALSSVSNLSDTNQEKCFNATQEITCPASGESFYGQDSQYSTNPIVLLDNSITIIDSVTTLEWQKAGTQINNWYQASGTADPTYNPLAATNVCGDLSLDGKSDWRLPSAAELISLENYAMNQPTIDLNYFPGTPSEAYWAINENYLSSTTYAWAIGFSDGYFYSTFNKSEGRYVRCVRAGPWGVNSFSDNGDGTVTDSMSGLVWQKNSDGVARIWQEALSYCENLNLASIDDWRLPDIKESGSIFDYNSINFINTTYFPLAAIQKYWTSTTTNGPNNSHTIDFVNGGSIYAEKGITYLSVRCVH